MSRSAHRGHRRHLAGCARCWRRRKRDLRVVAAYLVRLAVGRRS
jgi:hypothetical protein